MDPSTHARISELLEQAATNPNPRSRALATRDARLLMAQAPPSGLPRGSNYQPADGSYLHTGGGTGNPFPVRGNAYQIDQVHPPSDLDFVVPLVAPSRYLVVDAIPAVAANSDSPGERLEFSAGGGWLIGWRGSVVDFTAGAFGAGELEKASMGVKAFLNDGEQLITNGTTAEFGKFSDLFPQAGVITPLMRRVDVKDTLFLNFRNFQPAVGGHTLTPSLVFAFWREKYPGMG